MSDPVGSNVYDVPKRCACGAEWTGKAFSPHLGTEPRSATCDDCHEEAEAALRARTARTWPAGVKVEETPELTRPARVVQ